MTSHDARLYAQIFVSNNVPDPNQARSYKNTTKEEKKQSKMIAEATELEAESCEVAKHGNEIPGFLSAEGKATHRRFHGRLTKLRKAIAIPYRGFHA